MAKQKATNEVVRDVDAIPVTAVTKLRKLIIQNFGCIGNSPVTVELDDIVVLVGPNNAGKSTILRAYQKITESSTPKLSLQEFHQGKENPEALPTIELVTAIVSDPPASKWVQVVDAKNKFVRERWVWSKPEVEAKRQGWDVEEKKWSDNVPWGAPNIANSRRPTPHRLEAFADPTDQVKEVVAILMKNLQARLKGRAVDIEDENGIKKRTSYGKLLDAFADVQKEIVGNAESEINAVEGRLTEYVGDVFPGYKVKFDAKPEEDISKGLSFFKAGSELQMGPQSGHMSNVEKQGSGARRMLMWAALRYIAENEAKGEAGPGHLLLLDEPELCLHPNAIREACNTLYKLPETTKWQVMITTHSPVFIDLSKDNTTVVRVERKIDGQVKGVTVFRPSVVNLSSDEKEELKLLNCFDPTVAEFFFGGRTVIVEGDTEYTAFRYVMQECGGDARFKDVHVIRARGKATVALLAKILNHFGARYSVLHDADSPLLENGNKNSAWTSNQKILDSARHAVENGRARVVAALSDFETAVFGIAATKEKPYNAFTTLKEDIGARESVKKLLIALLEFDEPLPDRFTNWGDLAMLEGAVAAAI